MSLYTIYGGLGSPYSMKMRAVLRYRRLPHVWRQMQMGDERIFKNVKAPVIPVVQFADGSWHNDSTAMIFALEGLHTERSVLPKDPVDAFLAFLLEDFADEWGTKAMFHYRWFRERDAKQMSEWLAFDRLRAPGREAVIGAAATFRARQVGRMPIVGCTPENAPVIEESTRRILSVFEAFVTEQPYLFGTRPSLADFGWFGQMSQLAVDPTPQDLMRAEFPFAFRWTQEIDDASGVDGEWSGANEAVKDLLRLAGEIYFPFLLANAAAIAGSAEEFSVELLGRRYTQGAFKYQVKCLAELRAAYARLGGAADTILSEAGCLEALRGP
jgi:glutathione S-transferase